MTSAGGLVFIGKGKKTVDVQAMTERCESLGIGIDWRRIKEISDIRNDAEHRFTEVPTGAIQRALAEALVVVRDILVVHLNEECGPRRRYRAHFDES